MRRSLWFLVTSDQHGQEPHKHQDVEQDFERLPDIYPRRRRVATTLLCLFDAMSHASHEFSSLFDVELVFREGQIVQSFGWGWSTCEQQRAA